MGQPDLSPSGGFVCSKAYPSGFCSQGTSEAIRHIVFECLIPGARILYYILGDELLIRWHIAQGGQ